MDQNAGNDQTARSQAHFRFYEELNDFLPPQLRSRGFFHEFSRRASVKDMVESFGVPHTEVELILVNGDSVDFSYIVRDKDHISVYPMFESMDITPLLRLRPEPLRDPRFVLDTNLGKLARYLRMLGFDSLYRNDYSDADVATVSSQEQRILLTRDRALLQRKIITHGYFVRQTIPRRQISEVVARFDLYAAVQPMTRCTRCNGRLEAVEKEIICQDLQPKTRRYYNRFRRCPDCGQIYWKGSHHTHMERLIAGIMAEKRDTAGHCKKTHCSHTTPDANSR